MNIEKAYDKETGKTSWVFDQWYYKFYFWLGMILFWFYVACFVIGMFVAVVDSI